MTYAEPNNISSITDMFTYANTVTDGIFGNGIVLSLLIIVAFYQILNGEKPWKALVVASFMSSVTAVFLTLMGVLTGYTWLAYAVIFGIALLFEYAQND